MLATQQWDAYTIFAVLSGVVMVGMAFIPWPKISTRVIYLLLGIAFAAYGFYVAGQSSGTYFFPFYIFIFPFVGIFIAIMYMVKEHGAPVKGVEPHASVGNVAPLSTAPVPAAIPAGANGFDWWQAEDKRWYPPVDGKSYGVAQHPSLKRATSLTLTWKESQEQG